MSVMGSKLTTRAWSPAPQESSLEVDKSKKYSATLEDPIGDGNIGDFANKLVDPNYVDASQVKREKKSDLDKDAFFKLMLTQMKNQDPFNPLESHEMAAQLAQFTSMEQLFGINEKLETLAKTQSPNNDYQALNFIGKEIVADSSLITRSNTEDNHDIRFNLLKGAKEAEVKIMDMDGTVVRTYKLNNLKEGMNTVTWNGRDENDMKTNVGEYRFAIDAKDSSGAKIFAQTESRGRVTGVNYTAKGPVLLVGNQSVSIKDVKKIEDAVLKQEAEAGAIRPDEISEASGEKSSPPLDKQNASGDTAIKGNVGKLAMSKKFKDAVDKQIK